MYDKNEVVLVWPGAACALIGVKLNPQDCIPCAVKQLLNVIQIDQYLGECGREKPVCNSQQRTPGRQRSNSLPNNMIESEIANFRNILKISAFNVR